MLLFIILFLFSDVIKEKIKNRTNKKENVDQREYQSILDYLQNDLGLIVKSSQNIYLNATTQSLLFELSDEHAFNSEKKEEFKLFLKHYFYDQPNQINIEVLEDQQITLALTSQAK